MVRVVCLFEQPGNRLRLSCTVIPHIHPSVSAVNVSIGESKGQTVLPLPVAEAQQDQALKDKDKIHILETAIITWTKQIKNVLKADPDAALKVRLAAVPRPHDAA